MTTPYWTDGTVTVHAGDCRTVLTDMPEASVDAICTDPPYNLSDSGKRDAYCLRRIIAEFTLPDHDERDLQIPQGGDLAIPSDSRSPLGRVDRTVREDAGVGVPESSVDLQRAAVAEQEVHVGDEPATVSANADLASVNDADPVQLGRRYVLKLTDAGDAPFCDGTCSCFTEPSAGVITVSVALTSTTARDLAGYPLGGGGWRYENVGLLDDARRESETAPEVVAGTRAVVHAVLCLDLARRTGELRVADSADECRPLFLLTPTQSVGAGAGTGGLSSVAESGRVGLVGGSADRAFTIDLPWHALNPSRQTGGFMGKKWDGWESPAAFQRWCTSWARECLRVLKPGGHLLAFGGTRTYHRMACAIEDAGFEIRDSLHWLYGSGFPKSLDVSKAIDRAAGAKREVVGASPFASRKPCGTWTGEVYGDEPQSADGPQVTAPATDDAARWQGWGTALKPAHEPIIVARKPLVGTVAGNVLTHGTGALNIDACRTTAGQDYRDKCASVVGLDSDRNGDAYGAWTGVRVDSAHAAGRWPTNMVLTHGDCPEDGPCAPDCPVAELDRQSGKAGAHGADRGQGESPGYRGGIHRGRPMEPGNGGASRFFPTFRYEAKAPASERPRGADGTAHVTVKPLSLVKWLVRLVTPPGGLVLDPFLGSGTTAEACLIEGFRCVGIELDEAHLPLIKARLSKPIQPSLGFEDAS